MSTIANLLIKIGVQTEEADEKLKGFGGKAGSTLRKGFLPAVAVLGLMTVGAKRAADQASDLGESQNAVNVVFGKGARIINDFAKVADTQAGLSMKDLNSLVTPVGASLRNFGFSADDAAKSSVDLAKRAADMASIFNTSVPEALEAIQAGLRGEADPLERFGVGLNAAAVEAKALSMGLGKTTVDMGLVRDAQTRVTLAQDRYSEALAKHGKGSKEATTASLAVNTAQRSLAKTLKGGKTQLSDNAKMQARLALIMDQTNRYQGDFVKTSDQAANAARVNAAQQANLEATMGQGLLPVVQLYQQVLGKVLGLMANHTTATKVAVGVVGALAVAVVAVNVVMKLGAAYTAASAAVTTVWAAVQKRAAVAASIAAIAQWRLNAAILANPIVAIVAAIALLVAAFVVAYRSSEKFRNIVNAVWAAIKSAASAFIGWFTKALPRAFQAVLNWVRGNWRTIVTLISGPFAPLVALASNAFGIRDKFIGALNALKGAAAAAIAAIVGFFRRTPGQVASALSSLGGRIVNLVATIPGMVAGIAYNIGAAIVTGTINGFGALAGRLKSSIEGKLRSVVSSLNPFSPVEHGGRIHIGEPLAKGAISGWLTSSADLSDKMTSTIRRAVGKARAAVTAERASFATAWEGLASIAGRAFSRVQGSIQTPAEKELAAIQDAADAARRQRDIDEGHKAVADATAAGDAQALVQAQAQLDDALLAQKVYGLTKQAEAERANLDELQAQQQMAFDKALAALGNHLQNSQQTAGSAMEEMTKLLASYGINFQEVGNGLGEAFRNGLNNALGVASTSAGNVTKKVRKGTAAVRRLPGGNKVPKLARGGIVDRPTLALIGEAGPEAVVPMKRFDEMNESRRSAGPTIRIDTMVVQDATDIDRVASRLGRTLAMVGA